jgi:sugar (pentulose or hexulose) kinase
MLKDVLLGIDIGSTTIRCCIFDTRARQLDEVSRSTKNVHLIEGQQAYRAWGADQVWMLILDIMQEISSITKAQRYHPLGVAISSVGCSSVILDKLGNPLFPIISHKSGVSHLLQKYKYLYDDVSFQRVTGYPLESTSTAFILSLLKEQNPSEYARIDSILPVSNYISYKLTGEKFSDHSIAASYALWDHNQNCFWDMMLTDLELNSKVFGTIVNGGGYIGKTTPGITSLIDFPQAISVFSGGHDYLCAALAVGCIKPGSIFNIEGTFEITATFHPFPLHKSKLDHTRSIIDVHVVPHAYSLMTERIGSGQIEWLRNLLYSSDRDQKSQITSDWDSIVTEMQQLEDKGLREEVFIPYLFGELFPIYNRDVNGGILGLGRSSTRASIMRAAIFSHCYESKQMIDYHKKYIEGNIGHMISVGGITRNKYWMQKKADIIGMPIVAPEIREASALGAAMLAGLGAGIYDDYQQLGEIVHGNGFVTYEPDISKSERYFEYYQQKYLPALKFASRKRPNR